MSDSPLSSAPYSGIQRQEAADWFVVIHADEEPSAETLQAWLRWMDQHEGNRMAFESVAQAWHGTPASVALAMPSGQELQADVYEGDQTVEDWLAERQTSHTHSISVPGSLLRRSVRVRRLRWLAAATLAAATLGLLIMNRYFSPFGSRSDEFMTKTGEQIEITLADGSRVWLGPKSALLVGFTNERRELQLTSGEAFFSVKKDHSRPFVVRSTGGDITAVGTAFNVRAVSDHVTVAVSEGVVTVAPKTRLMVAQPGAVRVASGQQLTFTAHESIKALTITQSPTRGERSRWRDGVLVYRDEPLRDVVMDVARYSDRQLVMSGDAVGALHYSGVVYKGAVDEWTSALPESFPVKIVVEGNREIIQAK